MSNKGTQCLTKLLWVQELEGVQQQEQPGGRLELLLDPIKPDWQVCSRYCLPGTVNCIACHYIEHVLYTQHVCLVGMW